MSNEITVLERAVLAVGDLKGAFFALADKAKAICSCESKDDLAEVKAIYKELKDARIEADKRGKEVRDDAVKFQKGVISYVAELEQITAGEEARLKSLIETFEASDRQRIADAKQAKIDRTNRLSAICQSFVVIPSFDGTAESFRAKLVELESIDIAALDLAEYTAMAINNIAVSVMALANAIAACEQREAQAAVQAQLLKEATERAAVAEAKAKAEREEQERLAEIERQAQAAVAAEQLRLANERVEAEKVIAKQSAIAQSFVISASFDDTSESLKLKINELLAVDIATLDIGEYADIAHKNIMTSITGLTDAKIECKKREDAAIKAAEAQAALDKIAQEKRDKLAAEQAEAERIANEQAAIEAAELVRIESENKARIEREQSEAEQRRREKNKPDAENFRLFCDEVLMMISRKEMFIASNRAAYERLADAIATVRCDATIEMIGE